jgi:hypothetical protein
MPTIERPALKLTDILVEKLQAESPELFQEPARPKIDLRELQAQLLQDQRAARAASKSSRTKYAARLNKHRVRNRLPAPVVADCRVADTRTDASGKKLYFELSNGQCVRADKALKSTNLVIRGLVGAEIEANADRKQEDAK